jgi:Fe2+ or Zn2+ uptake regulation protein
MNKHQRFAVFHYLADAHDHLSFIEVIEAIRKKDEECVTVSEAYEHLTMNEVADEIMAMECRLRMIFP